MIIVIQEQESLMENNFLYFQNLFENLKPKTLKHIIYIHTHTHTHIIHVHPDVMDKGYLKIQVHSSHKLGLKTAHLILS